jgi:septum site-determining protein MinD
MTRLVAIASGKGGVGKTTVAINLACALSQIGLDAVVVDGDVNGANVSLHLGSPKLKATLHSVLSGKSKPSEALYLHTPSGTRLVPGDIAMNKTITGNHLLGLARNIEGLAHVALIDSAPGLTDEAVAVLKSASEVIVITTPDMPSVVDTLKTINAAKELGVSVRGAIINKSHGDEHELEAANVSKLLGVPIIGVVPEDISVRESLRMKHPVVYSHPDSAAAMALKRCAETLVRYRGQD